MLSLEEARTISDRVAARELHEQEILHRHDDPKVTLRLEDYKVLVSENSQTYEFFYDHDNADVEFELWFGHPMHFTVHVNRRTGEVELIGGK